MIPSRIIGRTSGDNWVGIIDSTYGIILTLLVIELPLILLESIEKNNIHSHLATVLALASGVTIIGYFAVFTVVYDIWSYHKTLLFDARRLRVFALTTGWIIFIASLIPPFYYLVNHFGIEIILHEGIHMTLLDYSRIYLFSAIAIIYMLLAGLSKCEKKQPGQNKERKEELEFVFGSSMTKALIAILVAVITDQPFEYISPPIGITVIALCTYFPINLFKKRSRA